MPTPRLVGATVAGLILVTLLGFATNSIASRYSLPSSADLKEVEARVLSPLKDSFAKQGLRLGEPIFIRIFKETAELELWVKAADGFALFKTFPICYFSGALGPKLKEGDGQSPEGFYQVSPDQMNPNSSYHLSFNIGFPNAYDRSHERTGSFLMVHGNCVSIGCYAMTDKGIEEIYLAANEAFKNGQGSFDVHIFPFRLTDENLKRHEDSEWQEFWLNLKQGYDLFDHSHLPPRISVENGLYKAVGNPERSSS